MDRSNFNPDQLHEHFDRISQSFGFELEDNARMIRFPTGHRFVLGRGAAQHYPGYSQTDVIFPLITEAGEVGGLHSHFNSQIPNSDFVSVGFDIDREGAMSERASADNKIHHIEWIHPEGPGSRVPPPKVSSRSTYNRNPDSATMDSIIKNVLERGGSTDPADLEGAGTIEASKFTTFQDGQDVFGRWDDIGKLSMNRKSGRFEWIPD